MNQVISRDGTTIAFDRSGQGPAVILVGGAFQYRAIDPPTAQLAALLAQQFTVFHYDRRGRGDSSDTQPYAVEREIEDLEALINEAGGSALVFGMSSGAALDFEAAARGLAITRLAVYEPPFNSGDEQARQAAEHYTRELSALLNEGRRGDAAAFAMTTWGAPAEAIAGMHQTLSGRSSRRWHRHLLTTMLSWEMVLSPHNGWHLSPSPRWSWQVEQVPPSCRMPRKRWHRPSPTGSSVSWKGRRTMSPRRFLLLCW